VIIVLDKNGGKLAALGHPILCDATYGSGRAGCAVSLDRHALHAASIAFRHPATGKSVTFRAELPADLQGALVELRRPPPRRSLT
jgi:23S rRNA pseudouridine1911/1915/1917 synthase